MKNICVIGVGNLGFRHYQALMNIDFEARIYLVDPEIAAKESTIRNSDLNNPKVKGLTLLENIDELPDMLDLVIHSTNSDVRARVTRQLIENIKLANILFEKVLFQRLPDYEEVQNKLTQYGIKAWVNCPLRLYPYYQDIKNSLSGQKIYCQVHGWDIACNTIHFIDLMEWFTGEILAEVIIDDLDQNIIESKRKGFVEFSGVLHCAFSKGSFLEMRMLPDYQMHKKIKIESENIQYELDEANGLCWKRQSNEVTKYEIRPLYQSELSDRVAKNIIFNQRCDLVTYSDSMRQHIKLIAAFKKHLKQVSSHFIIDDSVPVT